MSAPDYVDCLMSWTQGMLDNEEIFPSKVGECHQIKAVLIQVARLILRLCLSLPFPILAPAGVPFPDTFQATVKSILRRLFRVYAHIYNHHFAQICALSLEGGCYSLGASLCSTASRLILLVLLNDHIAAHLNTSYRHFLLFINEFHLVDPKELAPLAELNEAILDENGN
jgi:MOB kinase activator 1